MRRKIEVVSKKVVYENPWMKVLEYGTSTDGKEGIYGVVERENSIIILVYSSNGNTLLLNQYRFPTEAESWELPMGGIEKGEPRIKAAARELKEETGISDPQLREVLTYYPVPGLTAQSATVFIAEVEDAQLAEISKLPAYTDEIMGYEIVSYKEAINKIYRGEITDGFSVVGLLSCMGVIKEIEEISQK